VKLLTRTSVIVGIGVTAGVAGWAIAVIGAPTGIWIPIALGAAVALAPVAAAGFTHEFDPFEPVYLFALSYAVLFVARPIYDASRNGVLISGYDPSSTYDKALWIALVGACAFYVGYYSKIGTRIGRRVGARVCEVSLPALDGFIVAGVSVSIALFALLLAQAGGREAFAILTGHRTTARTYLLLNSSGYLYSAPLALLSFGVVLLVIARSWSSGRALCGIGLIALSQVVNFGSGDRSWTLMALAAPVLVLYLKCGTRPRPLTIVAAVTLVFAFGIVLAGQHRQGNATSHRAMSATEVITDPRADLQAFFGGADTAMAPNFAIELQYVPSRLGYRHGATYAEALTRPLPRAMWPDKPKAADTTLMANIWPSLAASHVGFSFSLFGEPYLNGGLIGVIVVVFTFGVFWRGLYIWFHQSPNREWAIAVFALSWPFMVVYMRGGIGVDYQRQIIAVLPAVATFAFAGRLRLAVAPAAGQETAYMEKAT
jgi:oligosaccharide repeat unit polymerase